MFRRTHVRTKYRTRPCNKRNDAHAHGGRNRPEGKRGGRASTVSGVIHPEHGSPPNRIVSEIARGDWPDPKLEVEDDVDEEEIGALDWVSDA
jgi:hypothetical protein